MRHGRAARYLQRNLHHLSGPGQRLAQNFSQLKTAREAADYDPNTTIGLQAAQRWIQPSQIRSGGAEIPCLLASGSHLANITLYGRP